MPKKSAATRSSTHRSKPKVQKSIELVREATAEGQETKSEREPIKTTVASVMEAKSESHNGAEATSQASSSPKGSAAARLAARRQSQRMRSNAQLITPEHFNYVRKDLITIGILAVLMFAIIIASYFILGV
ncbi:hypothetical protein EPA93_21700 [Ktedonosporobacter rubrisoli]|uniref:Uncharacterized protein n=1 Tax=Ktedonosporobacter rubrisoli TaxID=2509675 RepID=A0A4P6JU61_KTERU|nr:hypothetical protein [Ktedonosporobacter rubrisoli]QBD78466.1 hypothetical protein EPA93_21700 [Ktedonosporobacter rubrisoli]